MDEPLLVSRASWPGQPVLTIKRLDPFREGAEKHTEPLAAASTKNGALVVDAFEPPVKAW